MTTRDKGASSRRPPLRVITIGLLLAAAIFAFDLSLPLGVAGGVPYVALVLVGLWSRWPHYLLWLALLGTVLTILGYALSPAGGVEWVVLTNRGLALFAIWATALLAFQHKQSAERLRYSESRLFAIFDSAVDGIITIDERGIIETMNPAVLHIFGYESDEIVGRNINLLMPELDRGRHDSYIASYVNGGKAKILGIAREVMGVRKDGTTFPMDLSVSEARLGDDRKFMGMVRDATLRKQGEEALRASRDRLRVQARRLAEANTALSEYASAVSHDLKAPLRAMHNYADFLCEDLGRTVNEEQRSFLDGLTKAVAEAEELVDDLLTYGQISTKSATIEKVDLGEAIRDAVAALRLADDVEVEIAKDWPIIECSPSLLRQIIQNLVSNGIKFSETDRKTVRLANAVRDDGMCDILVADNGIGIESRFHERIFQMFQRLHTRSEYDGTGIGLAIVRRAANRLGGNVRVESEPGKGSTFVVSLPLSRAE